MFSFSVIIIIHVQKKSRCAHTTCAVCITFNIMFNHVQNIYINVVLWLIIHCKKHGTSIVIVSEIYDVVGRTFVKP